MLLDQEEDCVGAIESVLRIELSSEEASEVGF